MKKKINLFIFTLIFILNSGFSAETEGTNRNDFFSDLDMIELGPQGEIIYDTYFIGDGSQSYTARIWITPFSINRYETTYDLWYSVRTTAESLGYSFINPGQEGSKGRRGAKPTEYGKFQPVTEISWYDAVVWCNALSEISGLEPCYIYKGEVLKSAGETAKLDLCECKWEKNGYRLPSEAEWEYAARKTKSGFQGGGAVSGQVDKNGNEDNSIPEGELAWVSDNADGTRTVGTAGTPFKENAPPKPGSGNPNGCGIFDMSGNVLEFVWDWMGNYTETESGKRNTGAEFGSKRVSRGGSWSIYTPFSYAGDRYGFEPSECYNYLGFRIARTN